MISVRRYDAVVEAKRRLSAAITAVHRADKARCRKPSPAAREHLVACCRLVTEADDALESLGVPRG